LFQKGEKMISNMFVVQAGLIAGVVMGLFAMVMNMLELTSLNLTSYMGCMLTQKKSGPLSFAAGSIAHLLASVMFAFIYLHLLAYFKLGFNITNGAIFGVAHTAFSGLMLVVMDKLNQCVADKKIKAMGVFAQGHGLMGVITFALAHIIYAIVLIKLFEIGSELLLMGTFSLVTSNIHKIIPIQL